MAQEGLGDSVHEVSRVRETETFIEFFSGAPGAGRLGTLEPHSGNDPSVKIPSGQGQLEDRSNAQARSGIASGQELVPKSINCF